MRKIFSLREMLNFCSLSIFRTIKQSLDLTNQRCENIGGKKPKVGFCWEEFIYHINHIEVDLKSGQKRVLREVIIWVKFVSRKHHKVQRYECWKDDSEYFSLNDLFCFHFSYFCKIRIFEDFWVRLLGELLFSFSHCFSPFGEEENQW